MHVSYISYSMGHFPLKLHKSVSTNLQGIKNAQHEVYSDHFLTTILTISLGI